ncbi:concanavalin A-like lectin/glucanase [Annulohypoxylon moriforme]|nr:concanavalin A-like lectin/glucanase [Annulohypoxylon moriforme]
MPNSIAIFSIFLLGALGATSQQDGSVGPRAIRATSVNWSGVVIQGENISSVSGTFPVLEPGIPNVNETGKHAYSASVWVGIDGYNKTICPDGGLWQAGVLTQHHNLTGEIWYQPFYELYPDPPVFLDIGNNTAGDMIKVSLDVANIHQASVVLENLTTGRAFNQTVNITHPLCFSSAEWIVERSYSLSGLIGLLNFGTETIRDLTYTLGGQVHASLPDNTTILDIANDELNNTVQTSTEVTQTSIEITYLGS